MPELKTSRRSILTLFGMAPALKVPIKTPPSGAGPEITPPSEGDGMRRGSQPGVWVSIDRPLSADDLRILKALKSKERTVYS
jgi:hypothetical protein